MDWVCRVGAEGCGIEEIVSFVTLIAAVVGLIAGLAFARSYIRAASFSKPVVEGLEGRLKSAEDESTKAKAQAAAAMELVTGKAATEALVSEVRILVTDQRTAHAEQNERLKAHEERAERHDALIVQNLEAIAIRLERKGERRLADAAR